MTDPAAAAAEGGSSGGDGEADMAIFRLIPVHNVTVSAEVIGSWPEDGFTVPVTLDIRDSFTDKGGYKLSLDMDSVTFDDDSGWGHGFLTNEGNGTWEGAIILTEDVPSVTYDSVPDMFNYSIAENDYSSQGYFTEYTRKETATINADGVIAVDSRTPVTVNDHEVGRSVSATNVTAKDVDILFTNINAKNDVTVSKTVDSPALSDLTKDFTFDVTITLPEGMTAPTDGFVFSYTGNEADTENQVAAHEGGTITGNASPLTAQITLRHGQSVTIKDLPYEAQVTVAEAAEDFFAAQKSQTAKIEHDKSEEGYEDGYSLDFTNERKTGSLTIVKLVPGYITGVDADSFSFRVVLKDENGEALSGEIGEYSFDGENGCTVAVSDGEIITAEDAEDDEALTEFVGAWAGSVTLDGLPAGVNYEITEILPSNSMYDPNPKWDGNTGTISTDGSTATCTNEKYIYVTVEWGNLIFDMTNLVWDPESHTYSNDSYAPHTQEPKLSNEITVKNEGGIDVEVSYGYTQASDWTAIDGKFYSDAGCETETTGHALPVGQSVNTYLMLEGTVTFEKELADFTPGSITVTWSAKNSTQPEPEPQPDPEPEPEKGEEDPV